MWVYVGVCDDSRGGKKRVVEMEGERVRSERERDRNETEIGEKERRERVSRGS